MRAHARRKEVRRALLLPTTFAVDARTCAKATSSRKRYASKRRKTRREGTAAAGRKIYSISADVCSGPRRHCLTIAAFRTGKGRSANPPQRSGFSYFEGKIIRIRSRQGLLHAKNIEGIGANFLASPNGTPSQPQSHPASDGQNTYYGAVRFFGSDSMLAPLVCHEFAD